jgi:hypothetical protein
LGALRSRPSKKISEDLALEAFGFLEATVLKTYKGFHDLTVAAAVKALNQ